MQHPDEGTIHGWLDGALTPEETSAIESHLATCAECGAAVAEARGLRAAATRILSALDDVPAGVVPAPDYFADVRAAEAAGRASRRAARPLWRRPGVRAAAGLIAVAALSWAVMREDRAPTREGTSLAAPDTLGMDPAAATTESTQATTRQEAVSARDAALPTSSKARAGDGQTASGAAKTTARPQPPAAHRAPEPAPEAYADQETRLRRVEEARRADSGVDLQSRAAVTSSAPSSVPPPATAGGVAGGAAARTNAPQGAIMAEAPVPRIVIERGYVDSVLAADSLETADATPAIGRAPAAQRRAAAPQLERVESPRPAGSPTTMRAQGCWLLETSEWSPRFRSTDTLRLLPRRIELRLDRGVADEAGERLVRPAPAEPAFAMGTTGIWRVIATNQIRLTIATHERWTTVTMTVGEDSLSGTARAYSGVDRLLRRAAVSARRVVCRTEP